VIPPKLLELAPDLCDATTRLTLDSLRLESSRASEEDSGLFRYGFALLLRNESTSAVEILSSAVALNPSSGRNRSAFGEALLRIGRRADAIAEFREASRLGWAGALPRLVTVMIQMGDPERALILLKSALVNAPSDPRLIADFITALAPSFRWPELLAEIRRELPTLSEGASLRAMLGSLTFLGRPKEVIECAEWAVGRMPERRLLALHKGFVMTGDFDAARSSLTHLLRIAPP
jgi:Flp pilus assembly protein TadD